MIAIKNSLAGQKELHWARVWQPCCKAWRWLCLPVCRAQLKPLKSPPSSTPKLRWTSASLQVMTSNCCQVLTGHLSTFDLLGWPVSWRKMPSDKSYVWITDWCHSWLQPSFTHWQVETSCIPTSWWTRSLQIDSPWKQQNNKKLFILQNRQARHEPKSLQILSMINKMTEEKCWKKGNLLAYTKQETVAQEHRWVETMAH